MDKVWWEWQSADPSARLFDISGQNALYTLPPSLIAMDICGTESDSTMPPFVPYGQGAEGDPGMETTLGHLLNWAGILTNTTVGEVMDIQGGVLCYEYD
jgi:tyrosinase